MKKKKSGKAQILLWIYEHLLQERKIAKEDVLNRESISPITFKRYLYDIKDYLELNGSDYILVYARRYKVYKLVRRNAEEAIESSEMSIGSPKAAYH
jgi:DNA-binding CsgD family transcriptional regulator